MGSIFNPVAGSALEFSFFLFLANADNERERERVGIYRAFYGVSREILCFQRWNTDMDQFRKVIEFLLGGKNGNIRNVQAQHVSRVTIN